MRLNLTEQGVVVFGAARGIGRAIAEAFIICAAVCPAA
jgi:NAD(P)-dependent dehydrogenase (short-subunit alcohol dehydrogenase family)